MRLSLIMASGTLAASLVLSACSTSGSLEAPGAAQSVSPMGHSARPYIVFGGIRMAPASCPASYFYCYPAFYIPSVDQIEWCIVSSGSSCSPSNLAPGTWKWSGNKVYGPTGIKATKWSPNPGNPTYADIDVSKTAPDSNGVVEWYQSIEACSGKGKTKDCSGPFTVGISTISPSQ